MQFSLESVAASSGARKCESVGIKLVCYGMVVVGINVSVRGCLGSELSIGSQLEAFRTLWLHTASSSAGAALGEQSLLIPQCPGFHLIS